ncbi:hypothetical protein NIES4101_78530 [Calothrix sp. NIES-4101]|nr:hypothetical protein NIES4101_78530 [Calothrix sp. NIES-4101]
MSSNFESARNIIVRLPSYHPELLTGLEIWLELGLISNSQVRQICQEHLVCLLQTKPQFVVEKVTPNIEAVHVTSPGVNPPVTDSEVPPPKQPNILAGMMQSLMAELSVRWLLFLGIFLVVISSGLLAASQWERFPAAGQYGVLLAYTLSFFGVSFWANQQANLRLTTQGLLVVTQLLIPVNFWAMDGFKLWQNPGGWLVIAIAFATLTATTILIFHSRLITPQFTNRDFRLFNGLRIVNILGLSYLHLGWSRSSFPVVAIYIAMIGTSLITIYQKSLTNQTVVEIEPDTPEIKTSSNLPIYLIIFSLGLLLTRGIFITGIDVTQLGLAIAICGWLIHWLGKDEKFATQPENLDINSAVSSPSLVFPWQFIGGILVFIGWAVTVFAHPGQALAVSCLGLWIFAQRLQLSSWESDFAAIFIIGLQANWLIWRLVPIDLQLQITNIAVQITNSQYQSWTLWSLGLFPYLIATVVFTEYLSRVEEKLEKSQKSKYLSKCGEPICLIFGLALTFNSLVNPAVRSLNLLLSSITLAGMIYWTQRRQEEKDNDTPSLSFHLPTLIYLIHITAILSLCSCINWVMPTLPSEYWVSILLVLMVAEWLFSIIGASGNSFGVHWQRSAWYLGFGLAAVSFYLLLAKVEGNFVHTNIAHAKSYPWAVIWLVTPITLSVIASRSVGIHGKINSVASVITLGMAQLLTLPLTRTRLIGLGVGVLLMLFNTSYLKTQDFALITVGFILAFIAVICGEGIPGLPLLSISGWFVVTSTVILALWVTRKYLLTRNLQNSTNSQNILSIIYIQATNKWACILLTVELLAFTLHSVGVYQGIFTPDTFYILAAFITLLSVIFRSWHEPTNWAFYGIGWCLELLAAEALAFGGRTTVKIAITNIALGLASQLFGEWWKRRHNLQELPNSFHILPIIYALFSVVLRFDTFTSWTGLYTLGVALIVIGVGRRRQALKPLLYLGLIGVSIAAYECLFYQMLQVQGGAYGDGLIAMSALGAIIMYVYRILAPWLMQYLRLSRQEIEAVAHFHWGWSSCLLLLAILSPVEINRFIGLGTGTFLVRYAIFQGRMSNYPDYPANAENSLNTSIPARDFWVYLGFMETLMIGILLRDLPIGQVFTQQLLPWNAAIACIVAYFLYILPWERWGWSKRPWQNTAYVLPLVIVGITWLQIYPTTLLITAAFYAFLAKLNQNFRLTYLSIGLIDWALCKWFYNLHLTSELWYVATIGLSLLYIAQFDPELKLTAQKDKRHYLRLLGSGMICTSAVFFHQDTVLIPIIISILTIFVGLSLRIRAFLYVGTGAFLMTSIYQLVILSLRYSFVKWIIGLCIGIIFISIAANFETRREQLNYLFRNTSDEFQEWE